MGNNEAITNNTKDQATVTKAVLHLDEGLKAIATRPKHVKIAYQSELGWQVVAVHKSNDKKPII